MTEKVTFKISGMHCTSCAKLIEHGMKKERGVRAVDVEYTSGEALLEFDPESSSPDYLKDAVEALGYHVVDVRST